MWGSLYFLCRYVDRLFGCPDPVVCIWGAWIGLSGLFQERKEDMNVRDKCDWGLRELGGYIIYMCKTFFQIRKTNFWFPYPHPKEITTSFKQTFKLPSSLAPVFSYWPSSFLGHPVTTLLFLVFKVSWQTWICLCGNHWGRESACRTTLTFSLPF